MFSSGYSGYVRTADSEMMEISERRAAGVGSCSIFYGSVVLMQNCRVILDDDSPPMTLECLFTCNIDQNQRIIVSHQLQVDDLLESLAIPRYTVYDSGNRTNSKPGVPQPFLVGHLICKIRTKNKPGS
ncbi:hypothetical protein PROFUN_12858 [Planoprotostelium fungivorum]|uniref:Uncharacterized protein n=1 Tax=Planoprotostelium fungivorum TaxID=1890364 RepID=A0A2P6N6C2_9EUKA|nr:hypothetical protein PROFUN_12858 [Planoprotostelium fungivorum]